MVAVPAVAFLGAQVGVLVVLRGHAARPVLFCVDEAGFVVGAVGFLVCFAGFVGGFDVFFGDGFTVEFCLDGFVFGFGLVVGV